MAKRENVIGYLLSLWRRLRRRSRLGAIKRVSSMNDVPARVGDTLYVVGLEAPKWAVLACPCRCGERIDVNLMRNRKPHWMLSLSTDAATLKPSLWMPKTKCGSHFFIRENRIVWVRER